MLFDLISVTEILLSYYLQGTHRVKDTDIQE